MIQRHYITGDQLYTSYMEVVRQGVRPHIVARRYGLSTGAVKRALDELMGLMAGKELVRQKNRVAFEYALAKIQPRRKAHIITTSPQQPLFTSSTDGNTDPYERLNIAIAMLNTAVEDLIIHEVDRRAGEIKKELDMYKELAVKSNVTSTLKKHFDGRL